MNNKIGKYEGASVVCISLLPLFIYSSLGRGMAVIGASYWINFIISALVVYIFLLFLRSGIVYIRESGSKFLVCFFDAFYLLFALSYGLYSLYLGTNILHHISSSFFSFEEILYFTLLVSFICSICGIEALTRTAYVVFCILFTMVFIMCLISYKGWTFINFTPVLGNTVKNTFLDFSHIFPFGGLVSGVFITNYYSDGKRGYQAIKKALAMFFVLSFVIVVLCTLCTPYPMINHYSFSLNAVFSMAKSGSFFHRFEMLLIIFVALVNVMSLSFNVSMASSCICKLSSFNDTRMYSLIISGIFYLAVMMPGLKKYVFMLCVASLVFLLVIISVLAVLSRIKGGNNEISEG